MPCRTLYKLLKFTRARRSVNVVSELCSAVATHSTQLAAPSDAGRTASVVRTDTLRKLRSRERRLAVERGRERWRDGGREGLTDGRTERASVRRVSTCTFLVTAIMKRTFVSLYCSKCGLQCIARDRRCVRGKCEMCRNLQAC